MMAGSRPPFTDFPGVKSLYYCRLRPHPAHALDGECCHLAGEERLLETVFDLRFQLRPQSFFQVNAFQAERLYLAVLEALEITGEETALDAYCGAGTITLALAKRCKRVTGVEMVRPAILDARQNARCNGLENRVRFVLGDAAKEIPRLVAEGERFDIAVLDPPRKGADPRVLEAIVKASPAKLAYISCEPATLARDLKLLCKSGYRLDFAKQLDMFAYTCHVETIVLLQRKTL